jgi:hypothetical protein
MSLRCLPVLLSLALAILPAPANPATARQWRNADGTRTFAGEYLSHDVRRVTIRREDGRVFTLDLAQLHPDDRAWLAKHQATATGTTTAPHAALPDDSAVFDTLKLGDPHADVRAKLQASKAVELTIPDSFLARMGLNGSYRTRQQIGGQQCLLFFDWDASMCLNELTLQTVPKPLATYATTLKTTWEELAKLLTALHGNPASKAGFPPAAQLTENGMVLGSHLWRLEGGHSALLGTARDPNGFSVIVRFTNQSITAPSPIP